MSQTRQWAVAYGMSTDGRLQAGTETDRQIDRLVYDLYGLTEEEIRIVEANP